MRNLILFLSILFLIPGCRPSSSIVSTSKNNIYRYNATDIHPEFVVYHTNDTVSTVYIKVLSKELLYSKKESENGFLSKIKINYRMFESYESSEILDSATVYLADTSNPEKLHEIISSFTIKAIAGKDYILDLLVTDFYRNSSFLSYVTIEKKSSLGQQNFMLTDKEGNIKFNYKYENEPIYITFNDPTVKELTIRYYDRDFPLAAPPFSIVNSKPFQFQADELFFLQKTNNAFVFSPNKIGLYLIQADTILRTGLAIMYLNSNFPEIKTPTDLLEPLRYITTKTEFDNLLITETPKLALDSFWLTLANNSAHAKTLIKNYYTRVQNANMYFSSYQEGWKTDRGMIYIVFGPPNLIYRSSYSESWIYGEENNFNSVNFNFTKVDNPFTNNDYSLNRSSIYKGNFYKAVDAWRQGRIAESN